jgi:RNA polymerase sigma-70 factor, ECF subfamily
LDQPGGFRSWLLTIGRNLCVDQARAVARQRSAGMGPATEAAAEVPDRAAGPAATAERSEQQEHLLQLLESLPEDYRVPLMLRYLAGADHETIRTQLGLTDGALRGYLHRGMALLRERMSRETMNDER